MKKASKLFFLFLCLAGFQAKAQDYTLLKRIAGKITYFTTDHLGNSYLVNHGTIYKYDSIGNLAATFSRKDLGSPSSIDASDPMKILVFYKDFAIIRLLDTKLSLQSTVDLRSIGIQQPLLACNTLNQSGFWVYDEYDFTIKKVNNQLKIEMTCIPLNKLFRNVNVNFLFESESWIMINNPGIGVIVFDKTGDYFHTVAIKDLQYLQAQYDQLFYIQGDTVHICNIGSLERNIVRLPPMKGVIHARVGPHRLFLRKPDTFEIYSF